MIKRSVHQKQITILSMNPLQKRVSKYVKVIELKEEIDKSTITIQNSNIFLSATDRVTKQKQNSKDIDLNSTINK